MKWTICSWLELIYSREAYVELTHRVPSREATAVASEALHFGNRFLYKPRVSLVPYRPRLVWIRRRRQTDRDGQVPAGSIDNGWPAKYTFPTN